MHTMKGMVLRALNRPEEAQAELEQALVLEPVFAITHLHLGDLLAAKSQGDAAIAQYRLAIKKDARAIRAYVSLARLLAESDRTAEVDEVLGRAIDAARNAGDDSAAQQLQDARNRFQQQSSRADAP